MPTTLSSSAEKSQRIHVILTLWSHSRPNKMTHNVIYNMTAKIRSLDGLVGGYTQHLMHQSCMFALAASASGLSISPLLYCPLAIKCAYALCRETSLPRSVRKCGRQPQYLTALRECLVRHAPPGVQTLLDEAMVKSAALTA